MNETLLLLFTAHVLADFALQTDEMVQRKKEFTVFFLHVLIVAVVTGIAIGHWLHPALVIIVASHFLFDLLKTHVLPENAGSFLLDQALHIGVIVLAAAVYRDCVETGLWFALLTDPASRILFLKTVTLVGGIVLCIKVGGVLISLLVKPLLPEPTRDSMLGVPKGGRLIGYLERALVMLLIWIGQPTGVGFLVTAKSILRFGDIRNSEDRQLTEYVIIGTFFSFGWAILVTVMTLEVWETWG